MEQKKNGEFSAKKRNCGQTDRAVDPSEYILRNKN